MEFALVVPILIVALLMMVDFGRLMYVQLSVNSGAKEAVRVLSFGKTTGETDAAFITRVVALGRDASSGAASMAKVGATSSDLWVCGATSFTSSSPLSLSNCALPTVCSGGGVIKTITVATRFEWLTPVGLIGSNFSGFNLSGKAATLCLKG